MDQPPLSIMRMMDNRSLRPRSNTISISPAFFHRLANGAIHVDPILGTGGDHAAQALQGLADLGRGQGAFLGVIPVTAVHGHFDGATVAGNPSHAHASGVGAGMAHGEVPRVPIQRLPP